MNGFADITVVSVTGRQETAAGAALAVEFSALELPGSQALLVSPQRPARMPAWVRHAAVEPFGYMEYSLFMLHALHRFIDTAYALVVQDDGWVLSGRNWRQRYFDYDYIGAPVHLARVRRGAGDVRFLRGFGWCAALDEPGAQVDPILNGGFSLRSQRLMQAPQKLGLAMVVPAPLPCVPGAGPARLVWENDLVLEDVWLCITAREALESAGVRFAPLDVATGFAIEHASPRLHSGVSLHGLLGHHSRLRKIAGIGTKPAMHYTVGPKQIDAIYGEAGIRQLFLDRGWGVGPP